MRTRDRKRRLHFESTNFLVYLCDHLVEIFPDAKFICTVRSPGSWLRSNIDQCLNNPRDRLAESADHYRRLRDLNYGAPPDEYPPEEAPLAEHNLHSLSGFLEYWSWHYERVLDEVPKDRLLILKTEELDTALPRIARFMDVSRRSLSRPKRANVSSEDHGILDPIDEKYIDKKTQKICGKVMEKVNKLNGQIYYD
nr:sulfotransferase [Salinibacter ruber]